MKKTLIAIAALAATGAFAQSTVTIDGVMDAGLSIGSVQTSATAAATGPAPSTGNYSKTMAIAGSNTATTAINIRATEDLGGGMKASFMVETNPDMSGATTSAAAAAAGGLPSGAAGSAFGGGQRFVGLSSSWGSIKMGSPNSATLEVIGLSNPYGTGLGGGYSSSFSRVGQAAVAANLAIVGPVGSQVRVIRAERSIRLDSANYNGFAASFNYAAANTASNAVASQLGVQTIGLTYSAGPLNAGFATTTIKNTGSVAGATPAALSNVLATNAYSAAALNTAGLNPGESVSYNALSANYTMGAATVYAGYTTNKRNVETAESGTSYNLAVKYQLTGTVALSGNYLTRKDNTAANNGGKLFALGADYALSKNTTAYARYEKFDVNTASDVAGASTVFASGLRVAF